MTVEQGFNWVEAGLWMVMGVVVLLPGLRAGRRMPGRRGLALIAAPTLVLFGVSDVIEVYTGAWWSPWWLLVMKAACITVLAGCVAGPVRAMRRSPPRDPLD